MEVSAGRLHSAAASAAQSTDDREISEREQRPISSSSQIHDCSLISDAVAMPARSFAHHLAES